MTELTPAQRRELRASAHHLNPVVSIAGKGLSSTVLEEIERSLQAHELIKIKVHGVERPEREQLLARLCEALDAAPVQHIGTILIVWRKRREETATDDATKAAPSRDKRPSSAKSAAGFAAAARRAALAQASQARKKPVRGATSARFRPVSPSTRKK